MKKLNRKGFTLIELLAVIVILAIVLVVTIPSVLNSMQNARQGQFENALTTIEQYVEQEYDKCVLNESTLTGTYDNTILTQSCALVSSYSTPVITATGYTADIASITMTLSSNGKATISQASPVASGKFNGAKWPKTTS